MSVNNLGSALSQLDAVIRGVDASLLSARAVDDVLSIDAVGIRAATDAVETALGPTTPDEIRAAVDLLPVATTVPFSDLVTARVTLSRLGAAAHGVAALGGPDKVALAGGLSAIDGASVLVRQRLHDDANALLRAAGEVVDWGPAFISSRSGRDAHVAHLQAALATPDSIITASHEVTTTLRSELPYSVEDSWSYRRGLGGLERAINEQLAWKDVGVVEPRGFSAQNLAAKDSAPVAMGALLEDIPAWAPLPRQLPANEMTAAALPALERHARVLDTIIHHVGDEMYYSPKFGDAIRGIDSDLVHATEDLAVLRDGLAGGPDSLRAALVAADARISELRTYAGTGRTHTDGETMLPSTRTALETVSAELRALVDSPRGLHVGSDAADEVVEVLERRGALDVAALQQVIDDAGAPLAAQEAIVQHLPRLHAVADPAPARSTARALQLLREARFIGQSVVDSAQRTAHEPDLLLNHPTLVSATDQMRIRASAALGAADQVEEALGRRLTWQLENLTRHLAAAPDASSHEQPTAHLMARLITEMSTYEAALVARAERSQLDGGLRSIMPSARPQQALPAQVDWLMRELDQLPRAGGDDAPELHVDAAARRLATLANLYDSVAHESGEAARQLRPAIQDRVRRELANLDGMWRFPDDVARSLTAVGMRLDLPSDDAVRRALLDRFDPADRLRRAAADLRAWSMLPDGSLPSDAIDRVAVGDRRVLALRDVSLTMPIRQYSEDAPDPDAWLRDVDIHLADLDATLGLQMPEVERLAVQEALVPVRMHARDAFERRGAIIENVEPDAASLAEARARIQDLATAIAQTHLQLRSTRTVGTGW